MRLSLLPNLRQLWRDARTVQLGTDPARAVVLEFGDPVAARILDLLDGSRTEEQVLMDANTMLAIDVPDTIAVLNALRAAGLLVDAQALLPAGLPERTRLRLLPEASALALRATDDDTTPGDRARLLQAAGGAGAAVPPMLLDRSTPGNGSQEGAPATPADALRRRAAAKILVTGLEPLAAPMAVMLAAAGIGHVDPSIDGRERPGDLLAVIARTAPETRITPIRAGSATVVVRVGSLPSSATGGRWRRAAVLSVTVRDGIVLVGPFVRPNSSPCGRCLELHRSDRDPAWPVLAAQLATMPAAADTCSLTTTMAAAAYAAEEVLSYVDGRALRTEGAAVEIGRPGEARRRSWEAHPNCDCVRRQRTVTHLGSPSQCPAAPTGKNDG
ncbi:MAG: hypothetical protein JXA67_11935 [Micromonosporaceae bacterium]|nr:hypothetical protein [Micromonosporaceae bacterium]